MDFYSYVSSFLLIAVLLALYIVQQSLKGIPSPVQFILIVSVGGVIEIYPLTVTIINIVEVVLYKEALKKDLVKIAKVKEFIFEGGKRAVIRTSQGNLEARNRFLEKGMQAEDYEISYFMRGKKAVLVDAVSLRREIED